MDYQCFARDETDRLSLYLQVDGMTCASCAWRIEQSLQAHPGVEARVNFSTQRLRVSWPKSSNDNAPVDANALAGAVEALGFHVAPFDHESRLAQSRADERSLLACLAVAGFAAGNIMLFSQALWFSPSGSLVGATRDLMHWIMGLIALPATIYCGQPFFRSAAGALRHGRTNMDVPISLAVILANALSVFETIRHGRYVYFDASVMLLFFLLIGRYLDLKARGRAREAAEGLLAMLEGTARTIAGESIVTKRIRDLLPGEVQLVAAGEKIAADGTILEGASEVDTSLVTGESVPKAMAPGDRVYAGMINQSAPLKVEISSAADSSLLSEIVALMEKAEQSHSRYVKIADRVARLYAPVVHVLALTTFAGWMTFGLLSGHGVPWEDALLKAMAVLIITCPCALGLAVPVVHVLASSELYRRGILLKSGIGLEALAGCDTVVFDKTGTLTEGTPQWLNPEALRGDNFDLAIAMARQSQHPLSRAMAAGKSSPIANLPVIDYPGKGLKARYRGETLWLGKGAWLGVPASADASMELWFQRSTGNAVTPAIRLRFADTLREDAHETMAGLRARGFALCLLSGDREAVASQVGRTLGIPDVRAGLSPLDKVRAIEDLRSAGRRVLMVGDGLNDAAALAAATVSMSPATGMDITQNAADFVYRGKTLFPIVTAIDTARGTGALVKQNFAFSMIYNAIAVPAAIFGFVTPLVAALAMSGSSLVVVLNSLRLRRKIRV